MTVLWFLFAPLAFLLHSANAFVYPPPDIIDEWEILEDYRSRHNITFRYDPSFIHPEYCRYLTEEDCREEDRLGRIGRERNSRTHRSLSVSRGTFKALVLLVQFTDHADRPLPEPQHFLDVCHTGPSSIQAYLQQQSYGKYMIDCDVQAWKMTNNTEAYFAESSSGLLGSERAANFFKPVLDQLDADGIDWSQYDSDGDGVLDAVLVLHTGFAAEGGSSLNCGLVVEDRIHSQGHVNSPAGSWQDSSGGYVLGGFSIASAFHRCQDGVPARMGIMTHEWIHTFGPIDVYDLNTGNLGGLGDYCSMANAWGPRGTGIAPSMSPFSKEASGWITPTEITVDGIYELRPSNFYEEVYVLRSGFPQDEYLLIENRQAVGFDVDLASSGLLIYHIDNLMVRQSRRGFPGQQGWPENGNHYQAALLQADGNYDLERGINIGDASDFFTPGMSLRPGNGFIYPNTDSYQNGQIVRTGIVIDDITETAPTPFGPTMSFRVTGVAPAQVTPGPTQGQTSTPSLSPITSSPTLSPDVGSSVGPSMVSGSPTVGASASPSRALPMPTVSPTEENTPQPEPTESPSTRPPQTSRGGTTESPTLGSTSSASSAFVASATVGGFLVQLAFV